MPQVNTLEVLVLCSTATKAEARKTSLPPKGTTPSVGFELERLESDTFSTDPILKVLRGGSL